MYLSCLFMFLMVYFLNNLSSNEIICLNEHLLMLKIDAVSLWMLLIVSLLWTVMACSEFNMKPAFTIMMLFLLFSFTMNSLIIFFVSFESTLLPILYTIIQDGTSQERLKASFYMFFYTILSSMPLLFIILMMNSSLLFSYDTIDLVYIYPSLFLLMIFAFMVKMPVFFFHAWLPKAHVEASTMGSVFLAGLLLKLGSYGFYRFANLFFFNISSFILSLGLLASIISSIMCLIQTDLKVMIAFSSIVHMSMNLIILAQFKTSAEEAFILANFSHSMISAALFLGFGANYSWLKSRSSLLLKGMFVLSPMFFSCWFSICFLNMSLPPSIGFVAEVLMTSIILSFSSNLFLISIILSIMFLLVGAYCLMMFSGISHGKYLHKSVIFLNNNNLCLIILASMTLYPLLFNFWL